MTGTQTASTTREGSVSFSLKELARLEDERVLSEREEARRRTEALERSAAEEERRRDEAAAALAEREDARRRDEERRAREEAARLEGIQRALVERERLVAEQASREAEVERLRSHEIELARLRQASGNASRIPWAIAAVSVLALVAGGVAYAGVVRPDADRRLAEARQDAVARGELVDRATKQVDDLGKRVDGLATALRASEDRASGLQRQLDDAEAKLDVRRGAVVTAPAVHRPVTIPPPRVTGLIDGPCKNVGDPLCTGR